MRWLQQRLPGRLRRLDVEPEEIVVLDLQLSRTRLVGVARLHFRNDAAAFVAQSARLVERLARPRAHEAAVALVER